MSHFVRLISIFTCLLILISVVALSDRLMAQPAPKQFRPTYPVVPVVMPKSEATPPQVRSLPQISSGYVGNRLSPNVSTNAPTFNQPIPNPGWNTPWVPINPNPPLGSFSGPMPFSNMYGNPAFSGNPAFPNNFRGNSNGYKGGIIGLNGGTGL